MKRNCFVSIVILMIGATVLGACGGSEKKPPTPAEVTRDQYQCPMKCSDQLFDKPGKCPVCDMDLEKVTKS